MLGAALKNNNPYRIGIALHTYADTWSHQNFTGLHQNWNSVYPWYNIFKSIAPNIGHAEAGHSPDAISDTWTDHRLGEKIDNRKRAFEATGEIYKTLRNNSKSGPRWSDVKKSYKMIINAPDYNKRKTTINDFLIDNNMGSAPKYSEHDWIDNALNKKGTEITMNSNFANTHWHHFHLAAKTHFAHVLDLIKPAIINFVRK